MKSIIFGKFDSYRDLGLILIDSTIESPKVKEKYVSIDGTHGSIDLCEIFGEVLYENRHLSFTFACTDEYSEAFTRLQSKLHGKKMNIKISDDELYHYVGRISIDKWKSSKAVKEITIDCECEPFKYRNVSKIYRITSNPQTIKVSNDLMRIKPSFLSNASMNLSLNGKNIELTPNVEGSGLILKAGDNNITVSGCTNGNLIISGVWGTL